jgi:hypothetical protein
MDRFKLHLKPSSASARASNAMFPLPKNKSAVNIFADFMKYLYDCTRAYIRDTYANGANLWDTVERNGAFDLILTHPNGWEGAEQSQMRSAAISAGIVPDTPAGRCRVHFVTEGEASLHYCIQAGLKVTDVEVGGISLHVLDVAENGLRREPVSSLLMPGEGQLT